MECQADVGALGDYEEVKQEIAAQLAALRDTPQRHALTLSPLVASVLGASRHRVHVK